MSIKSYFVSVGLDSLVEIEGLLLQLPEAELRVTCTQPWTVVGLSWRFLLVFLFFQAHPSGVSKIYKEHMLDEIVPFSKLTITFFFLSSRKRKSVVFFYCSECVCDCFCWCLCLFTFIWKYLFKCFKCLFNFISTYIKFSLFIWNLIYQVYSTCL